MSEKITIKSLFKNSIFFILLIGITFFILLKDNNINDIIESLKNVNLFYIFIGIGCMFLFISCEAMNIKRMLKLFSYDINIFCALKYAFVGFFFSSITPSASGGQPMQIYYMNKDKIKVSHSSLAILMELSSFQFVTIVIAIISLILNYELIFNLNSAIIVLIIGGIVFNFILLCFVLCAIFSKKLTLNMADFIFKLLGKIRFINVEHFREKVYEQIEQYQEGAVLIKENKIIITQVILTTLFQISFMYSITFFIYKAFGLSSYSFLTVFSLQSILYIAVSAIPLPGAVGASESSFLILFKALFPQQILSIAMLLSRGVSFYLFVLISGVVVACAQLLIGKKRLRLNSNFTTNKRIIAKCEK